MLRPAKIPRAAIVIVLLLGLLISLALRDFVPIWRTDPTLSHAPLLFVIAGYVLWTRKELLAIWEQTSIKGLIVLALSAFFFVAGEWADVPTISGLALWGIVCGTIWSIGGWRKLRHLLAPLGLTVFALPWPTAITTRVEFWLQLTSSAYAALFAGLAGAPVKRDGVSLFIQPDPHQPPIYSILVAQKCSGLSSMMALLSLGYLVAWHTPIRIRYRPIFLLAVLPMTLFANALRLAIILFCGAHGSPKLAQFVHDNEQPVLMLFCGIGLMGLRSLAIMLANRPAIETTDPVEDAPPSVAARRKQLSPRTSIIVVCLLLIAASVGAITARRIEDRDYASVNFFRDFQIDYRGWRPENIVMSRAELAMLEPDAVLARRYLQNETGLWNEISVIAGHRKKTVHNPAFCIGGDGWESISEEPVEYRFGSRTVHALRTRIYKDGKSLLATYFFTNGAYSTPSMAKFQLVQIGRRLRSESPFGALIRVLTPIATTPEAGIALTDDFCNALLPPVLDRISSQ